MKKFTLILLATMGISLQSHAGFMIEPYLGYEMGENPDVSGSETTGTHIGVRLGGSTLGLMYGVEYDKFTGDYDDGTGSSEDVDSTDMGVYVGYEFPILLNVRLSYFLSSEAEIGTNELEGNGMKIGVGWTALPFLNINLDKVTRTYDTANGSSLSTDIKSEGWILSVSLPLP